MVSILSSSLTSISSAELPRKSIAGPAIEPCRLRRLESPPAKSGGRYVVAPPWMYALPAGSGKAQVRSSVAVCSTSSWSGAVIS